MNSEAILRSNFLDIIFEKRNKDYGAYMLRKFYNDRLMRSLGIMMLIVIVLSTFTFLPGDAKIEMIVEDMQLGKGNYTAEPEKKKEIPKQIESKDKFSQKKMQGTPVITNAEIKDSIADINPTGHGGAIGIISTGSGAPASGGPDGVETIVPEEGIKIPVAAIDVTKPISNPEVMPEYPGGLNALRRFLEKNLRNPRDLEDGEKISVMIKFVIGYDGKLKGFEVGEDGGGEFNNEVIRVLKKMPEWIPGKSHGQNVSVYYSIPVKFIPE